MKISYYFQSNIDSGFNKPCLCSHHAVLVL